VLDEDSMLITVKSYQIIPTSEDAVQYNIHITDDADNKHVVTAYCSRTLRSTWGIEDNHKLFESLYPWIRRIIAKWIQEGTVKNIDELGPIALTTYDAPKKPPHESYSLPNTIEIKKILPEPSVTYAVFISHTSADRKLANCLKQFLTDFHIKAFVAHDDIELGDIWEPTIIENVRNSKIMIALGSKGVELSPWVNFETGLAYDKMFPILLEPLSDKVSYVKNKQGINMVHGDLDSNLLKLSSKVLSKLGLTSDKKKEVVKALPSFQALRNEIRRNRQPEKPTSATPALSKLYISRTRKGNHELAEIFNKSNEDIIDMNTIIDYIDKTGEAQRVKAKFINHTDDPLRASPSVCRILKRKETKYIANFPRVKALVLIQGIEAGSNLRFDEQHKVSV